MSDLFAIVLAAGEGRRMGAAKALLEIEGATLVEHHVARLCEIGCEAIAVVVRPSSEDAVLARIHRRSAVHVEAVETGSQAESLVQGLRVIDGKGASQDSVVIVTPVDMLPASVRTHRHLLDHLTRDVRAITPLYQGRGGHPVIARRSMLAPYEGVTENALPSLREVLDKADAWRARLEVDDPRILGDFDTPSDIPEELGALCRSCGLCCDGSLFGCVPVDAEELMVARKNRLRVLPRGNAFEQPCVALSTENDRVCSIYSERPRSCRDFICRLYERHQREGGPLEARLQSVKRVRSLLELVEATNDQEARVAAIAELTLRMDQDFARASGL